MKIQKRDGTLERRILIATIVDPTVCSHVTAVWNKELFQSKWANLVAGWCVSYFQKYGKPPGKVLEGIFESWSEDRQDQETVKLVERFLESLSGEYEQLREGINPDFILDKAAEHFNKVKLERLARRIEGDISAGHADKALGRITKFSQVQIGTHVGIDVLRDENAIREAFQEAKSRLIEYPGAVGRFFADSFQRDSFVSFLGPEKRGKTWWLIDVAWRGMLQRRKVAFFSVGDMSQHQLMRRFQCRAARRPLKKKTVLFPTSITHDPDSPTALVELEEREFEKDLTWRDGIKAFKHIIKKTRSKATLLKLACYPNSTISVDGISSVLQTWEHEGWTPDVVVIDYADILDNLPGYTDSRDAINATWKRLRSLSQRLHCLVVTATQADAASYRANTMGAWNFSEDKRKLAHVTGMVGLNQTPDEKEIGVMRLNWIVLRESEFNISRCVHVAGCMHVGRPCILSCF